MWPDGTRDTIVGIGVSGGAPAQQKKRARRDSKLIDIRPAKTGRTALEARLTRMASRGSRTAQLRAQDEDIASYNDRFHNTATVAWRG